MEAQGTVSVEIILQLNLFVTDIFYDYLVDKEYWHVNVLKVAYECRNDLVLKNFNRFSDNMLYVHVVWDGIFCLEGRGE